MQSTLLIKKRKQNKIGAWLGSLTGGAALIVFLLIAAFIICLPGIWFGYDIDTLFGKHIPGFLAWLGGVFSSPISLPLSIIFAILRACGMHAPLFPHVFH